ncbi:MAG: sarcosine oxidase subunit delta [Steroidobacterales bacterium]
MSLFTCPFCGLRNLEEFVFHKTLPNVAGGAFEAIYLRRDTPGSSDEHWQHRYGCRAWLRVRRNPSTGEVLGVQLLTGTAP